MLQTLAYRFFVSDIFEQEGDSAQSQGKLKEAYGRYLFAMSVFSKEDLEVTDPIIEKEHIHQNTQSFFKQQTNHFHKNLFCPSFKKAKKGSLFSKKKHTKNSSCKNENNAEIETYCQIKEMEKQEKLVSLFSPNLGNSEKFNNKEFLKVSREEKFKTNSTKAHMTIEDEIENFPNRSENCKHQMLELRIQSKKKILRLLKKLIEIGLRIKNNQMLQYITQEAIKFGPKNFFFLYQRIASLLNKGIKKTSFKKICQAIKLSKRALEFCPQRNKMKLKKQIKQIKKIHRQKAFERFIQKKLKLNFKSEFNVENICLGFGKFFLHLSDLIEEYFISLTVNSNQKQGSKFWKKIRFMNRDIQKFLSFIKLKQKQDLLKPSDETVSHFKTQKIFLVVSFYMTLLANHKIRRIQSSKNRLLRTPRGRKRKCRKWYLALKYFCFKMIGYFKSDDMKNEIEGTVVRSGTSLSLESFNLDFEFAELAQQSKISFAQRVHYYNTNQKVSFSKENASVSPNSHLIKQSPNSLINLEENYISRPYSISDSQVKPKIEKVELSRKSFLNLKSENDLNSNISALHSNLKKEKDNNQKHRKAVVKKLKQETIQARKTNLVNRKHKKLKKNLDYIKTKSELARMDLCWKFNQKIQTKYLDAPKKEIFLANKAKAQSHFKKNIFVRGLDCLILGFVLFFVFVSLSTLYFIRISLL